MKNKTEVSRTDVCLRVVKGALEGGGGVMAEKIEKIPPSPASQHHSSPPLSPSTPPKIKCESPTVFLGSHTPPPSGPGAEIKGRPGNPIASASARPGSLPRPTSAGGEEGKAGTGVPTAAGGGRLTFFKEGKFLLELSHRTDMGAPAGWVPVKSKTYWPPPSSTTTTTTQHPLRHDTPTSQSVSDDCSSLNSSPWTNDHIRKQPLPRPARGPSNPVLGTPFWFCCPPKARTLRRRVTGGWRRRNPLFQPPLKEFEAKIEGSKIELEDKKCVKKEKVEGESARGKGTARVEKWVRVLWMKAGVRVETNTTLQSLFEQRSGSSSGGGGAGEAVDPTFVSPRKRYLRQMETDQDVPSVLHRKKLHAAGLPQGPGDRGAGPPQVSSSSATSSSSSSSALSVSAPHRSAMNAFPPSVYSIESILNHEGAGASAGAGTGASRRGDSFLRTLLKPEAKPSPARPRERPPDPPPPTSVKAEREQVGSERGDSLLDLNRPTSDRYDLSRYGPVAGLYQLAPYVDPRYMMLHTLAPGLVAPSNPQSSEMGHVLAAAAAAAAAAGLGPYPLGPLPPPLPGAQYYYPPTSVAAQLLRPPASSSRSSPHPPASPSPKTHYPPPTPVSPHLSRGASPRGRASPWQPNPPPAHPLSPHPSLASPLPSPPPQDAPLNLSKPRNHNHLGK